MQRLWILMLPLSILMSSCSADKPAPAREKAGLAGMVESQTRAMQKAKNLDGILLEADKQRRETNSQ
ncbi:hypothetical protein [Sulfuriflexus sp.]|uniref:hypothetical protein n=1 Tax=Sulfuriflexus sp. TaxID=2015443 RepID=UPI0028CD2FF3|nr:hypothetical protein [Sulfuriflexus sp.]MDT8404071.1 hypothetical protein [Sulfuriflexus sp.]